jgi:hypothetical protein
MINGDEFKVIIETPILRMSPIYSSFFDSCVFDLDKTLKEGTTGVSYLYINFGENADETNNVHRAIHHSSGHNSGFISKVIISDLIKNNNSIKSSWETSEDVKFTIEALESNNIILYHPRTKRFNIVRDALLKIDTVSLMELNDIGCPFVIVGKPIKVKYNMKLETKECGKDYIYYKTTTWVVLERINTGVFKIAL